MWRRTILQGITVGGLSLVCLHPQSMAQERTAEAPHQSEGRLPQMLVESGGETNQSTARPVRQVTERLDDSSDSAQSVDSPRRVQRIRDAEGQASSPLLADDRAAEETFAHREPLPQLTTLSEEPEWAPATSEVELITKLEGLRFGPEATPADFRARDELVAAIADLPDPIIREHLFKRLEEHERAAQ